MGNCKGCEGCSAEEGCCDARSIDQDYTDHYDTRMHKCRCVTCLVKMICTEVCKPYEDLWDQ